MSALLTAASCGLVEGEDDNDPAPAATAGSGGSAGGVTVGKGGEGAAGTGAGGDGTTAPPGCDELVGLGDCGVTSLEAEYSVANIMLVIDKSLSMVDQPEASTPTSGRR